MNRYNSIKIILLLFLCSFGLQAQTVSKEQMLFITSQWQGERFADGRPNVADDILERIKSVTIEEAWGVLRGEGYHNQFEGGWKPLHDDVVVVGRALTAQYMPNRPDVSDQIKKRGKEDGRIGNPNSWPIDMLEEGDVYVDILNRHGEVVWRMEAEGLEPGKHQVVWDGFSQPGMYDVYVKGMGWDAESEMVIYT